MHTQALGLHYLATVPAGHLMSEERHFQGAFTPTFFGLDLRTSHIGPNQNSRCEGASDHNPEKRTCTLLTPVQGHVPLCLTIMLHVKRQLLRGLAISEE